MKVTPLYDRVLLKRLEEKEVKKGGIIIPDTAKEKPQEGDRVLIGKYSGTEVTIDDVEHVILREEEILAKID
jgi:chaperonin GroES